MDKESGKEKLGAGVVARLMGALPAEVAKELQLSAGQIREDYRAHFLRVFGSLGRRLSLKTRERRISFAVGDGGPLIIEDWTLIRLARVWLLSQITDEREAYFGFVDKLFAHAEMQELVALYSALNVLNYPEMWIDRCKEGIRSNIGPVQQAIMEQNKYPFAHLPDDAWNQMVLKSFFTEKDPSKVHGLFERQNRDLAVAVVDYIYERHSAKRSIHPALWQLAGEDLPERARGILRKMEN